MKSTGSAIGRGTRAMVVAVLAPVLLIPAPAVGVLVSTPGGSVDVDIGHAGPSGGLAAPSPPSPTTFRPPSMFSAPLPTGSGARALGLAGAFTAVADDATAASWNPAGLVQLQKPEASIVFRYSHETDQHSAGDGSFEVGEDTFDGGNVNYMSLVYPFHFSPMKRNAVVSLNYQETYDFEGRFHARQPGHSGDQSSSTVARTFSDTSTRQIHDGDVDLTFMAHRTTRLVSTSSQVFSSDLLADVDFRQEGILSAVTPALAVEVNDRISVGCAANYHHGDIFSGGDIHSDVHASYEGTSSSRTRTTTTRTTSGTFEYQGLWHLVPGLPPVPFGAPPQPFPPFTESSASQRNDEIFVKGDYWESNQFDDLDGWNATLGAMVKVSPRLTLGGAVDLPWTAEGEQTRTVRTMVTTYDAARTRVLAQTQSEERASQDVEIDFPLRWAVGLSWRWTPVLRTMLDVAQTRWSDFAFRAGDQPEVNPLDGQPVSESRLDDTWDVRAGIERFVVLRRTEIPLRAGLAWEQRPALESPDEYYTVALGTGVPVGKGARRVLIDIAYAFTFADGVRGVVPERPDLETDVQEHQVFLSAIYHF